MNGEQIIRAILTFKCCTVFGDDDSAAAADDKTRRLRTRQSQEGYYAYLPAGYGAAHVERSLPFWAVDGAPPWARALPV